MLSERHTPGFKSPWGTQIGSGGNTANGEEVNDPVFIDKMPWIGDGGDRVRFVVFLKHRVIPYNFCIWSPPEQIRPFCSAFILSLAVPNEYLIGLLSLLNG